MPPIQQPQQPQPQAQPPAQQQQASSVSPLPATGLQQQLAGIQQSYQTSQQAGAAPPQGMYGSAALPGGGVSSAQGGGGGTTQFGQTNIQQLAKNLATQYGLPIGRGEVVDPQGNVLMTPDQLAKAGGGSMGEAAAKLNYISQSVANAQNQQQQEKGIAALQTGLGLVQSRGRGSLAAMQSGFYEGIADMYANQDFEGADFSYFIQKEQLDIQQDLMARAEKMAKKSAQFGAIGGLLGGAAMMFVPGGQAAGASMLAGGIGSLGGTGWF